jgi:F0F1-type ATP synthase assembly protein I
MAQEPERRDAWEGYGTAWSIIGTILAGLAVWGAVGFGLDRLAGFRAVFLPIGLILGAVGGVWLVIVRYGRQPKE